jgi:hypothetical protein
VPEEISLLGDVEQKAILQMIDDNALDVKAMTETVLLEDSTEQKSEEIFWHARLLAG